MSTFPFLSKATARQPQAAAEDATEEALVKRYETFFDGSLPSLRIASWALAGTLLLLLFAIPLISASWLTVRLGDPTAQSSAPIRFWSVGSMSSAHASFGTDCKSCHRRPFLPVEADACLSCHKTVGQHADIHLAPAARIDDDNCQACHHEHKGPTLATRNDQAYCVSCHRDLKASAPQTDLHNVTDFSTDHHPQFAPTLVGPDGPRRVSIDAPIAEVQDRSNLRFTHAKHLTAEGLKRADGVVEVLDCAKCHTPDSSGRNMMPVRFEQNCQRCHRLTFDPDHGDWQLAHGQPDKVAAQVLGFYSRAQLYPWKSDEPADDIFARPGDSPTQAELPAAAAQTRTLTALGSSVANSTCGLCHPAGLPPNPASAAWKVGPVFTPANYLTKANFTHAKHIGASMPCELCHAARTSDAGPTALIPGIGTCLKCHAGEGGATGRVASTCVACHGFHNPLLPLKTTAATQ